MNPADFRKIFYFWHEKEVPERIEVFTEDTEKKPSIPTQGKFARIHERFLSQLKKRSDKNVRRKNRHNR